MTEKLQNMEIKDCTNDIPILELNKMLKLTVIIDDKVR